MRHLTQQLLGSQRANHALAELLRAGLKFTEFEQLLHDIFHHASAFLNVSHFSAAEDDGDLNFVLVLQESLRLVDFETDVVLTCFRSQANLLCLAVMAVPLAMLFLAFVVLVLAVIHDTADGWFFSGSHFNQVESHVASTGQGVFGGKYAELFTFFADNADLRNANVVVHPSLIAVDCLVLSYKYKISATEAIDRNGTSEYQRKCSTRTPVENSL